MRPFKRTGMFRKRLSSGKRSWTIVASPRSYSMAGGKSPETTVACGAAVGEVADVADVPAGGRGDVVDGAGAGTHAPNTSAIVSRIRKPLPGFFFNHFLHQWFRMSFLPSVRPVEPGSA